MPGSQRSGRIRDLKAGLPTHIPLHFSKSHWRNGSANGCLYGPSGHIILQFCDCPAYPESLAGPGKLWLHPGPETHAPQPHPQSWSLTHTTILPLIFLTPSQLALPPPNQSRGPNPQHPQLASPSEPPEALIHAAQTPMSVHLPQAKPLETGPLPGRQALSPTPDSLP